MTTYQESGKEAGTIGQIIDQRFDVTQAHIVDVETAMWNHTESIGSQIRLIDQRISRTVDQLEGRITDAALNGHRSHDKLESRVDELYETIEGRIAVRAFTIVLGLVAIVMSGIALWW